MLSETKDKRHKYPFFPFLGSHNKSVGGIIQIKRKGNGESVEKRVVMTVALKVSYVSQKNSM